MRKFVRKSWNCIKWMPRACKILVEQFKNFKTVKLRKLGVFWQILTRRGRGKVSSTFFNIFFPRDDKSLSNLPSSVQSAFHEISPLAFAPSPSVQIPQSLSIATRLKVDIAKWREVYGCLMLETSHDAFVSAFTSLSRPKLIFRRVLDSKLKSQPSNLPAIDNNTSTLPFVLQAHKVPRQGQVFWKGIRRNRRPQLNLLIGFLDERREKKQQRGGIQLDEKKSLNEKNFSRSSGGFPLLFICHHHGF